MYLTGLDASSAKINIALDCQRARIKSAVERTAAPEGRGAREMVVEW